jgi:hypothetical protein
MQGRGDDAVPNSEFARHQTNSQSGAERACDIEDARVSFIRVTE